MPKWEGATQVRYLVTGGAGFIGSHLVDALTTRGDRVLILDDLSTGSLENVRGPLASEQVEFVEGSVLDAELVDDCMAGVDRCFHLASAVGVELIVSRGMQSLLNNLRGNDIVISAAARRGKRMLFTSSSEVYGKNAGGALSEDSDRLLGSPLKARWSYAMTKALGEALAHGYHSEQGAETIIVRLFNAVGPRQTGAYGMVLPRFVRQALDEKDLTVYGKGTQLRCFVHVLDAVHAILMLMDSDAAVGGVLNVGSGTEVPIIELAGKVIERTGSSSRIRLVTYEEAYGEGFEELGGRRPDTSAVEVLTGWTPGRTLEDAIDDTITHERGVTERNALARAGKLKLAG
jgi:nucleoside-diphosphate-sugar epimerase